MTDKNRPSPVDEHFGESARALPSSLKIFEISLEKIDGLENADANDKFLLKNLVIELAEKYQITVDEVLADVMLNSANIKKLIERYRKKLGIESIHSSEPKPASRASLQMTAVKPAEDVTSIVLKMRKILSGRNDE